MEILDLKKIGVRGVNPHSMICPKTAGRILKFKIRKVNIPLRVDLMRRWLLKLKGMLVFIAAA